MAESELVTCDPGQNQMQEKEFMNQKVQDVSVYIFMQIHV